MAEESPSHNPERVVVSHEDIGPVLGGGTGVASARVEGLPADAEAQRIRHADHAAAGADGISFLGERLPKTHETHET